MITTKDLGRYESVATYAPEYSRPRKPHGNGKLPEGWERKLEPIPLDGAQVVKIPDVHLCGTGLVGIKDRDIILDTAYYGRLDLYERNYPYFLDAKYHLENTEPKELDTAVSMSGVWAHNYFHWVLDHLPKLELIGDVPIILSPEPPAFAIESLDLTKTRTIPHYPHYFVKELIVPTTRRYQGRLYPSAAHWLNRNGVRKEPRKYYVSREHAPTRRVKNSIVPILAKYDIGTIWAEYHQFYRQLDMFSRAELIISPHGAGLANVAWAPKGVKVLELVTPEYPNPCCWLAGDALGADYRYLVCDPTGNEDLIVDTERLDTMLGNWL